jgi:hypothetical protein
VRERAVGDLDGEGIDGLEIRSIEALTLSDLLSTLFLFH